MAYVKVIENSWCASCVGCCKLENEKFRGLPKVNEEPKCYKECYTEENKIKKLQENNEPYYYGSRYGNNN